MVNERVPPEPERTIFVFGTSEEFDEIADRVSDSPEVSMSEMLKAIGEVVASSSVI